MPLRGNPNEKYELLLHGAKQGRLAAERETWLNLAFYLGQQYSEWHTTTTNKTGYLRDIPRAKGTENHPRCTINKIMHFVRSAHNDALQDRPTGDVLPASSSYSDIGDAKVSKAWIEDQSEATKLDYDTVLSRAAHWALMGGGYLKWQWDGPNDCPSITAPSFFEIYLDPYAKSFGDCRYIIQSQFMDPEQVYDTYGVDVKGVSSADETKTELLRGMGSSPAIQGVIVNEVWMKPSRRNQGQGLYKVWTGRDELVPEQRLPYKHLIKYKMLPYTQLGVIERPDSAYYMSPVQYLRPPQMELNKYHSQMMLNRERFSNSKWWIPSELQLDQDPDDSPSQILRGSSSGGPGFKPEIIQPSPFPAGQDLEVLEQGMMHVVGSHEVSNAQVPGRVEAAKAIELLKEADAGALAVLRKTIQVSNDQGWYHLLQLAREFQQTADMVTSYTREGIPEVKEFKAGEMAPGQRVRTAQTTGLARSRTNRSDLALRLWELQAITDPEELARILEMPLENTMSTKADSVMLARNENVELKAGKAIAPQSWHDHRKHLEQHDAFRNTQEFNALPPETKQKFEFHCSEHKRLEKIALQEQVELQMISQGGQPPQPAEAQPPSDTPTQEAPNAG